MLVDRSPRIKAVDRPGESPIHTELEDSDLLEESLKKEFKNRTFDLIEN